MTSPDLLRICCKYHSNAPLVEDTSAGDVICSQCGLVVGDRVIDVGSEWRNFNYEKSFTASKDRSRVGWSENPLLDADVNLSTRIGPATGSASFDENEVSLCAHKQMMGYSDRALVSAFEEIRTMAERINLPKSTIARVSWLFKQVRDGTNLKSRSNEAVASACLYIACRQERVPRTFKEICAVSSVKKKEIGRCFRLILKALETPVDVVKCGDYMSRFCSNLGLSISVQRAASHIACKAVEINIVPGKSPISVAAAAIYMASQASVDESKKTQREIGEVAGITDFALRQSYKLMIARAAELFPDDFPFGPPMDKFLSQQRTDLLLCHPCN